MSFKVFKNTVLLFVLVLISCGNNTQKNQSSDNKIQNQVQDDNEIIVGANRTSEYLPLLNGKRVGIVANQTSVIFKNDKSFHPKRKVT